MRGSPVRIRVAAPFPEGISSLPPRNRQSPTRHLFVDALLLIRRRLSRDRPMTGAPDASPAFGARRQQHRHPRAVGPVLETVILHEVAFFEEDSHENVSGRGDRE